MKAKWTSAAFRRSGGRDLFLTKVEFLRTNKIVFLLLGFIKKQNKVFEQSYSKSWLNDLQLSLFMILQFTARSAVQIIDFSVKTYFFVGKAWFITERVQMCCWHLDFLINDTHLQLCPNTYACAWTITQPTVHFSLPATANSDHVTCRQPMRTERFLSGLRRRLYHRRRFHLYACFSAFMFLLFLLLLLLFSSLFLVPYCRPESHQRSRKVTELHVWGVCACEFWCTDAWNDVHASKELFRASEPIKGLEK